MAIINTLNESALHKALKTLYTANNEGSVTETKYGPYIVDIKTADGDVIEIQTQSLSHLVPKIKYFIEEKKKIRVVYPLITTKYIETHALDGSVKTKKSPSHQNIYTSFKEFTKLTPYLLSRYFFLDVVEVVMVEERKATDVPVQSANGRRRFKKAWVKVGKRPREIGKTQTFHGKKSYKALLPKMEQEWFSPTDYYTALREQGIKLTVAHARLMLWVYSKAGLVTREKVGRKYLYSFC